MVVSEGAYQVVGRQFPIIEVPVDDLEVPLGLFHSVDGDNEEALSGTHSVMPLPLHWDEVIDVCLCLIHVIDELEFSHLKLRVGINKLYVTLYLPAKEYVRVDGLEACDLLVDLDILFSLRIFRILFEREYADSRISTSQE